MAVTLLSDKVLSALRRQYQIHNITHLSGSDSVITISYNQDIVLSAEIKRRAPSRKRGLAFLLNFHFALIVSEKIKRREVKGVVIKHNLYLIVSSVTKEVRKGGDQTFKALDPDKTQKFQTLAE